MKICFHLWWLMPPLSLLCAPPPADLAAPEALTRISQTTEALRSNVRQLIPVRLTAAVYCLDRVHGGLVLKDESGFLWLETAAIPEAVEAGAQVLIEGTVAFGNGRALLGKSPVVESADFQGPTQQGGSLRLKAGKNPFRLDYFQSRGARLLETRYQGPNLTRTNIPGSVLCHPDPMTVGRFLPGVRYEYYEGAWTDFPNLETLPPVASGTATNFSAELGRRATNFALRFTGCLEVAQEGLYEFTIRAGDSVRMNLDYDPSNRIEIIGRAPLAAPHRLHPGQAWGELADPSWVMTEGTVKQAGTCDGRMQLELSAETGRMRVTIADGDPAARLMLLNNRIRIQGLGWGAGTPQGNKVASTLLAPSMAQVTILQADDVNWQMHPVCTIDSLAQGRTANLQELDSIAHLRGTNLAVTPGKSLLLRDETGQIEVLTSLARTEDRGGVVDVLGQVVRTSTNLGLRFAAVRQGSDTETASRRLPRLTSVEQIRRLKISEATLKYPARFKGVVTFVFPGGMRAHVQGETEGLYVAATGGISQPLHEGDLCEFEGYTAGITISPIVTYRRCTVLGPGQWPEPLHPSWSQLMTGTLDAQWVEVQGVVLRVSGSDLTLGMRNGEVLARVFHGDPADLPDFVGAVVRVHGTVRTFTNQQRQVRSVIVQISSPLDIALDAAPPADPFAVPSMRIADFFLFDPNAGSIHFVKTTGQIVAVRAGTCHLMDGTNGLRFTTREKVRLVPGDLIEAAGIPENDGFLPSLRQASARTLGHAPPPPPRVLNLEDLTGNLYDSTLVQTEAVLLNITTNQLEQTLELQAGPRSFLARLDNRRGLLSGTPPGSRLRLTSVYASQALSGTTKGALRPFELLLNSPRDVIILARPSWWTLPHSLLVLGTMTLVLAAALGWIRALRNRVEQRTRQLREEIAGHQQTEASLNQQTRRLEAEIEERKRVQLEVERVHRELVDASRQAGQAEVAVSVLHNVGNVLNSVNVSTSLLTERVRNLHVASLAKAAELMESHAADLPQFLTTDEKGRRLPRYLGELAHHLGKEQQEVLAELNGLGQNVEHIKEIVAMQQSYAKRFGVLEQGQVSDLAESAIKLQADSYARHAIRIVREYGAVPPVTADKHKVLQILVNLLQNAGHACQESSQADKQIIVRIDSPGPARVRLEVADNGIGIAAENMTRIFAHGFTTRKDGHGFGLHSAALAAKEMGGSLEARSQGLGQGAAFTLELPIQAV